MIITTLLLDTAHQWGDVHTEWLQHLVWWAIEHFWSIPYHTPGKQSVIAHPASNMELIRHFKSSILHYEPSNYQEEGEQGLNWPWIQGLTAAHSDVNLLIGSVQCPWCLYIIAKKNAIVQRSQSSVCSTRGLNLWSSQNKSTTSTKIYTGSGNNVHE